MTQRRALDNAGMHVGGSCVGGRDGTMSSVLCDSHVALRTSLITSICTYLNYDDILKLGQTCRSLYTMIVDPRVLRTVSSADRPAEGVDEEAGHTHLWRHLCLRENLLPPHDLQPQKADYTNRPPSNGYAGLYASRCVTFYLLELSAPGARQEFYVCSSLAEVKQQLVKQFCCEDSGRMLIQLLCRLGLDVVLYVAYKSELLRVAPLYEHIMLKIGDSTALTFKYLGGLEKAQRRSTQGSHLTDEEEGEGTAAADAMLVMDSNGQGRWERVLERDKEGSGQPGAQNTQFAHALADDGFKLVHRFFRGGRLCRYEINRWSAPAKGAQMITTGKITTGETDELMCVQCPPDLFCDIVFLPVHATVQLDSLFSLCEKGRVIRPGESVLVNIPLSLQVCTGRQHDGALDIAPYSTYGRVNSEHCHAVFNAMAASTDASLTEPTYFYNAPRRRADATTPRLPTFERKNGYVQLSLATDRNILPPDSFVSAAIDTDAVAAIAPVVLMY